MNNNQIDWSLLRSFLGAIDHGSLLGAARAIGTSQPTLGRHIAELERQLGVILFERTGRGLVPTQRAMKLADAARTMSNAADQLQRMARAAATGVRGTVRVSASQPVACILLPPILARLRQALPEIQIDLVVTNAVSNLLKREADIALRMVRPRQSSLVMKRIGTVSLSACAHRSYLARCGTPLLPDELLRHDLIASGQDGEFERGAAALGLPSDRAPISFRSDDLMAQWFAVKAGLGIGFISDYVIASDDRVDKVLPMLRLPPLPVWLTVHREIRTSAPIRAVYDFLAEQVPAALSN